MSRTGLTNICWAQGGVATGKSTVSNMLRELGIPVIDADAMARRYFFFNLINTYKHSLQVHIGFNTSFLFNLINT